MQPSASVLNGGFEEEAKALQDELSKMQQQLSQRMARYNQLNEFNFSSQADSAIPSSTNQKGSERYVEVEVLGVVNTNRNNT